MAGCVPKEKAGELIELYGDMLEAGTPVNELEYRRAVRDLEKENTANAVSALGILHAAAGKFDKAYSVFETALSYVDDPAIAANYIYVTKYNHDAIRLRDKSLEFVEKFQTKKFTALAFSSAYRFGYRDLLIKYIDQHIKLLSDEEGRELAILQKAELLSEIDDAYNSTGCSPEQFNLLAEIVATVAKDFSAETGLLEVSRNGNKCYVADIKNKDPKSIAQMNFALAEAVCMEPRLDDCELIARFSAPRILHTGVSYVDQQY